MQGSNLKRNKSALRSSVGFDVLTAVLRTKNVFRLGAFTALILLGAMDVNSANAQQVVKSQVQPVAVATPWTNQAGRTASRVEATPKRSRVNNNGRIRQASAVLQEDDLLGGLGNDYQIDEELEDTSTRLENLSAVDNSVESVEELPPETFSTPLSSPNESNDGTDGNLVGEEELARPLAPTLSTEIDNYPQGNVNTNTTQAPKRQGSFTRAVSPRPSTNPYARIGQTEYNPNQFYGGGGNYSENGYRNAPPDFAYGQSVCGTGCCDNGCGIFGSLLQNTVVAIDAINMRNPLDFSDLGNTGADVAINWSSSRPLLFGLSPQLGARATFSDYYGTTANGFDVDDSHNQLFWTAGLYFRAPACSDGWSGGVVYDALYERSYREYDLSQLRAELSYSFSGLCEVGFRGAFSLTDDDVELLNLGDEYIEATASPTSYYTMFIRRRAPEGAEFTVFGGATEWGEGLLGASGEAPLSDSFALRGAASYVFPNERGLHDKKLEESWNISVGLAWYVGGNARNGVDSQRPLFDVADNGSFLQNFLR